MSTHMEHSMDDLLREAAKAHNASLPLDDWKQRILADAETAESGVPAENILAFAPPARKPFYRKALPYACAAAALVVVFAGIGAMGGFSRLSRPAAQAPAAAAGADMAAAEAAPAAAAPQMAAESGDSPIPESEEDAFAYTAEEPAAPAPAPEAPAEAAPAEVAPAAEAPAEAADTESVAMADAGNGASASSRTGATGAGTGVFSGNNRAALTAFEAGTSLEDLAAMIEWLTLDPAAEVVPFRIFLNGEERHGRYAVYDAETFEALDFLLPSGLAPETYLFQNAEPGGRYLVTVLLDGELYAFGVEL